MAASERNDWTYANEYWNRVERFGYLQKRLRRALTLAEQAGIRKEIEAFRKEFRETYPSPMEILHVNKISEARDYRYKSGRGPH